MNDQEQKQEPTNITPQPDAENKKESGELSEEELKKATGGGKDLVPPRRSKLATADPSGA